MTKSVATTSSPSIINIDSLEIDLQFPEVRTDTGNCRHFTIRGYVAEMREKDIMLCEPFASSHEELPPLVIPNYRYWRCEVDQEKCVLVSDGAKVANALPVMQQIHEVISPDMEMDISGGESGHESSENEKNTVGPSAPAPATAPAPALDPFPLIYEQRQESVGGFPNAQGVYGEFHPLPILHIPGEVGWDLHLRYATRMALNGVLPMNRPFTVGEILRGRNALEANNGSQGPVGESSRQNDQRQSRRNVRQMNRGEGAQDSNAET